VYLRGGLAGVGLACWVVSYMRARRDTKPAMHHERRDPHHAALLLNRTLKIWRSKLARDPKTTYSATVGWLISGVRNR
jgi:hypothetical protein